MLREHQARLRAEVREKTKMIAPSSYLASIEWRSAQHNCSRLRRFLLLCRSRPRPHWAGLSPLGSTLAIKMRASAWRRSKIKMLQLKACSETHQSSCHMGFAEETHSPSGNSNPASKHRCKLRRSIPIDHQMFRPHRGGGDLCLHTSNLWGIFAELFLHYRARLPSCNTPRLGSQAAMRYWSPECAKRDLSTDLPHIHGS